MSTALPRIIEGDNLSDVWARMFLGLMAPGAQPHPIVMSLAGMVDNAPAELPDIRAALDEALAAAGECSCKISANTIFPYDRWRRKSTAPRNDLYDWYLKRFLPRAKARDVKNRYGTYFERMINATGMRRKGQNLQPHTGNQLEHIIQVWAAGIAAGRRPRRSALQLSCFDPAKDHTGQPVRGFPCLQQVSFSYDDGDGISISALYPTQYIFERAYGNYLGLCHLGDFLASALGLRVERLNCLILQPEFGVTKASLAPLETQVRAALDAI